MTLAAIIGSILGSVIVLFLGQVIISLNRLTKKVEIISENIAVSNNSVVNLKENCTVKHNIIDKRLNDHSERIKSVEIKVSRL